MPPDTEQKPKGTLKRPYFIRWLRKFLLLIIGLIVAGGLSLAVAIGYLAYTPINVTSLIKPWLPLTVVAGKLHYHPAGRLEVNKVILAWPAWKKGFFAPITLDVEGIKILDMYNQVQDHLDQGSITLSSKALWHKKIMPLSVYISGLDVKLKRKQDYKIQLDLPNQKTSHHASLFQVDLRQLKQIKTQNVHVQFIDAIHQKTIDLMQMDVDIHPFYIDQVFAAVGHATIEVNINGHVVKLLANSPYEKQLSELKQQVKETGKLQWSIQFNQINPSEFSVLSSSLSGLSHVDLPISLQAHIGFQKELGKDFLQPYSLDMNIDFAKGQVVVGNQILYPSSGHVHVNASLSTDINKSVAVKVSDVALQLRSPQQLDQEKSGPLFTANASLNLSSFLYPKTIKIDLSASSALLDFASLKDYWPEMVAKGAHAWVTENMTAGTAHDFRIEAGLSSENGWKHLKLSHLGGGIRQAEALEVHWLRPIPPLKDMTAQMQFVDTDRIYIQYQGGYQVVYPKNKPTDIIHKLSVPDGDMLITGLTNHDELGIIHPHIQGKLQDLLALLSEPRLRLLSRHPVSFKNPSGDVMVDLQIELPLKKKVKIEQIGIKAHNEIQNAYLGDVAIGKDLKNASLIVDVDTKHLELKGKGIFSVFPVTLQYTQNFYHETDQSKTEIASANVEITPETLKQMDVDTAGDLTGKINLFVDYTKLHNGTAKIQLKFDMNKAGLSLPIWSKPINAPGILSGDVLLDKNKLVGIRNLQARGKDLAVQAEVSVLHNVPQQLNIISFQIGRSVGQASLVFPMTKVAIDNPANGDIKVSVKAQTLDVSPLLKNYLGKSKIKHAVKQPNSYQLPIAATGKYDGPRGRRWVVNLQARKIYYNSSKFWGGVTAYMEYNGVRLMRLSYGMRQPTLVTASLFPKGGNRTFHLEARDLGVLLDSIGLYTQISGGNVVFKGNFDDHNPSAPFKGSVDVGPFTIKDAPSALKKLSDLSIYGLFTRQNRNNIVIDALKGSVFLNNGILHISDGRVYNDELGATLQGDINLDHAFLDLDGTIVPAYAVNKLLGHIPGVGKIFSPEKGGGFLAVTFGINGGFKKPQMQIYPARLLTPGILRKLF